MGFARYLMRVEERLGEELDRIMGIRFPAVFQSEFEKLQDSRHTVRIIPSDPQQLKTFNCYAFALRVVENPRYQRLVRTCANPALANSVFVSALLSGGKLVEITEPEANAGDLIFYFSGVNIAHSGVLLADKDRVRSKWGPNELYEHGRWEVRASYGDQVRFYAAPDSADCGTIGKTR